MPIERTWELLNVKYVITWRQELFVPSTIIYEEAAPDGMTYLHRLETVGPRAWLVNQVEIADHSTTLQKIADPGFDRWQIALLEPNTNYQNSSSSTSEENHATHHALRTAFTPSRQTYQVSAATPALLMLSEPYYPGWQATVDGQPAPILRADTILRAIPVPAGEHTIEMTFRPLSFTLGAIISALALTFIGGTIGYSRRKTHQLK
jgi:uncharacterized membrane protein YfhO